MLSRSHIKLKYFYAGYLRDPVTERSASRSVERLGKERRDVGKGKRQRGTEKRYGGEERNRKNEEGTGRKGRENFPSLTKLSKIRLCIGYEPPESSLCTGYSVR